MKLLIVAIVAPLLLAAHAVHAEDTEQPLKVDVCQVMSDPIAYDHKLIELSGRVSRGFEDFTVRGTACADGDVLPLWLEYGGPQPAVVTYCCVGEQEHPPNGKDPLWIDGIRTSLDPDSVFRRFDHTTAHLQRGHTVRATLIGRLFAAGTYTTNSGDKVDVGYGHFGIFSLLVIQQVVEVSRR